jgi:hypothetical protein
MYIEDDFPLPSFSELFGNDTSLKRKNLVDSNVGVVGGKEGKLTKVHHGFGNTSADQVPLNTAAG